MFEILIFVIVAGLVISFLLIMFVDKRPSSEEIFERKVKDVWNKENGRSR